MFKRYESVYSAFLDTIYWNDTHNFRLPEDPISFEVTAWIIDKLLILKYSPKAGIGPATYWLTASRSAIELLGLEKRKSFSKIYYSNIYKLLL